MLDGVATGTGHNTVLFCIVKNWACCSAAYCYVKQEEGIDGGAGVSLRAHSDW